MERLGTVLVFKRGVTEDQIRNALVNLTDIVDLDYNCSKDFNVNSWDDDCGSGPVWYIP